MSCRTKYSLLRYYMILKNVLGNEIIFVRSNKNLLAKIKIAPKKSRTIFRLIQKCQLCAFILNELFKMCVL